jgi:hypothetical protein
VVERSPQISGMLGDGLGRNAEGSPVHGLEDILLATLVLPLHFLRRALHILGERSEEPVEPPAIGVGVLPSAFVGEEFELGLMEVSLSKEGSTVRLTSWSLNRSLVELKESDLNLLGEKGCSAYLAFSCFCLYHSISCFLS